MKVHERVSKVRRGGAMALGLAWLGSIAGCGGGRYEDELESESRLYGRSVSDLNAAPESTSSSSGRLTLETTAYASTLWVPDAAVLWLDPVTLDWDFNRPARQVRTWYVAAWLADDDSHRTSGGWRVRTLWVVRGSDYVSSRDFGSSSDDAFVSVTFPNPPFSRDGSRIVVELVRGSETRLLSAIGAWRN